MASYIPYGITSSTWSSYKTAHNAMAAFMRTKGQEFKYPIDTENLAKFIIYLDQVRRVTPNTIKCYVAYLKEMQELSGYTTSVFNNERITKLIAAVNNIYLAQLPEPLFERMAITIHDIKVFGHTLSLDKTFCYHDKQVIWVTLLIAFYGALRLGSILPSGHGIDKIRLLSWNNIKYISDNHITIFIPLPKHIKDKAGYVRDFYSNKAEPFLCPVSNLYELHHLKENEEPVQDTDHVLVFKSGKHFSTPDMNSMFKNYLNTSIEGKISCHSVRAGLPSFMASHPAIFTEEEMMDYGDWKSVEAARRYQRSQGIARKRTNQKLQTLLFKPK